MDDSSTVLEEMLRQRLAPESARWLAESVAEIEDGVSVTRFACLLSLASRFVTRRPLAPDTGEQARAWAALPGWSPERWTQLEAARVRLVLADPAPEDSAFAKRLEDCFRYADEGELCALYRSLAHLPRGERFTGRAGEGCRSNMRSVFEATACHTPYPARFFDDAAWRQLVIKAVFIEAPLWRVHGLDGRLSPELARMALDLADERRSANRRIQPQLWLCIGTHGGARARSLLEAELDSPDPVGRRAAALGLARAGELQPLRERVARETDPDVARTLDGALERDCDQRSFAALDPQET